MTLYSCLLFWSFMNGLDPRMTQAVISVESNGRVFAVGSSHGEIGLMQIRPQFVPYSRIQLLNGCTNIMVGTGLLGKLKESCKLCKERIYVNSYNLGVRGAAKLKRPVEWGYHKKILAKIK